MSEPAPEVQYLMTSGGYTAYHHGDCWQIAASGYATCATGANVGVGDNNDSVWRISISDTSSQGLEVRRRIRLLGKRALRKLAFHTYYLARALEDPHLFRLRRRGVDVDLFHAINRPWVHALSIRTVLDIGANTGRAAVTFHSVFPEARICSFEPLPDCFAELQARMYDVPTFVGLNIGLGDRSGELPFERSAFSEASSFLRMAELHKEAWPSTRETTTLQVRMERLDDLEPRLPLLDPLLIKIDVQGFEAAVLRGGEHTIRRSRLVIVETAFAPLYENQALFGAIYQTFTDWGFAYCGAVGSIISPRSGRPIAEDSIFVRDP